MTKQRQLKAWMATTQDTLVPYPLPSNSIPVLHPPPRNGRQTDQTMISSLSPRTASQQIQDLTQDRFQALRRPRHVHFYRNGDRFFKGKKMLITPHRYSSFEDLLSDLTRSMKLPYGVRQIFTPQGSKVLDVEQLKDGESYVCASFERLQKMKYGSSNNSIPQWNTPRKHQNDDSHLYTRIPVGFSYPADGKYAGLYGRSTFGVGHTGPGSFAHNRGKPGASFEGESKAYGILHSDRSPIKPKLVKIVKTGSRPRKVVSLLINKRSVQSYEQLVQDVSDAFGLPKYKNHRVRKLYTLRGKEVKSLADFYRDNEGAFIASTSRTNLSEDTIIDIYEELFPDNPYAQNLRKKKEKSKDIPKNDSGISDEDGKVRKNRRDRNRLSKDSDSRLDDGRGSDFELELSHLKHEKEDAERRKQEEELEKRRREEEEFERKKREAEQRLQEEARSKESELQKREEELQLKEEEFQRKKQEEKEKKEREREEELTRKEAELKQREEKLGSREKEDALKHQDFLEADAKRRIEEAQMRAQTEAERKAREAAENRAAEEAARREEAENRAREEIEKRNKDEQESRKREEAERKARLEAELVAREQAARRASAERRVQQETDKRIKQEIKAKEQEEAERRAREAERIAREEAETRALSEKHAREEAEKKTQEAMHYNEKQEEERRKREEAERLAKLEAELQAEAERRASEKKRMKDANHKDDTGKDEAQTQTARYDNDNITYKDCETDNHELDVPTEQFIYQPRTFVKKTDVLAKYIIGRKIGDGNFADVHEAMLKNTEEVFAMKIIDKAKLKNKEHMVENEIAIMKNIRHPNIVRLFEEYETRGNIYLVMEYVTGGDLFDAITESVKFTEGDAALMVTDLASALAYLHGMNVVHRDLKPENLLVNRSSSGDITLKLADFGLAMEVKKPIFTVCGTPTYVAPEILAETGYGLEVDMWALGVITYILLCGFPPFRSLDRDQEELFELIQAGQFEYLSPYWDNISSAARDLIDQLLVVDKSRRYTAAKVLKHPWIIGQGVPGIQPNLQREVSMNLEKNFDGRKSGKRKVGARAK